MNISGVSSISSYTPSSSVSNRPQMSDEQKDLVNSVLEGYDSSSLSEDDASAIVAAFQEAGIQPSRDLANTMSEAGFSASEVGQLAGIVGPAGGVLPPPPGGMPPPPAGDEEEIESISSTLEILLGLGNQSSQDNSLSEEEEEFISSLLSEYDSDNISSEDASAISTALKEAGIAPSKELASAMSDSGFDAREIGDLSGAGKANGVVSFESVMDYTSRIMSLNENSKEQVKELFDSYKPENTELTVNEASKVVVNSLSQILSDSANYKGSSYYA